MRLRIPRWHHTIRRLNAGTNLREHTETSDRMAGKRGREAIRGRYGRHRAFPRPRILGSDATRSNEAPPTLPRRRLGQFAVSRATVPPSA